MTLDRLIAPGLLLRDSDGDTIADGVAGFLVLLEYNDGAIDLAARLGLESACLTLPVAGIEVPPDRAPVFIGLPPSLTPPFAAREYVWCSPLGPVVKGERAARWLASAVVQTPASAAVFDPDGTVSLLVDGALVPAGEAYQEAVEPPGAAEPLKDLSDLFGPVLDKQVVVPEGAGLPELAALCDLAARLGVEATEARFPVAARPGLARAGAPAISWDPAAPDAITLDEEGVSVGGREPLRYLASTFPYVGEWGPGHRDLRMLRRPVQQPVVPGEPVLDLAWSGEWEVAAFRRRWEEMLPLLGARPTVDLRLSEPRAVREKLAAEMAGRVPGARVRVGSAHKQGLCWLEEEVLPRLRDAGLIERIEIAFRRFVGRAPAGEQSLEMEIRWLQELYPADDLLAELLGIDAGAVTFTMAEDGPTYVLTAYAPGGRVVLEAEYEAVCGLRRYMDGRPRRGWVHPPTGWLTITDEAKTLCSEPLATDAGLFWDWYQQEALPLVRETVMGLHPAPESQPFFAELEVRVRLSEENRRLSIREEQVSPLDALHEDIYFFTLDWFAELGREVAGAPFTAPGAVLPWVDAADGTGPAAAVRLRLPAGRPAQTGAGRLTSIRFVAGVPAAAEVDGVPVPIPDSITRTPRTSGSAERQDPAVGPLDEVIGPDQLPGVLGGLAGLPGVTVWQAGRSLAGRECWAIELRLPSAEAIRPPGKLSALKPVLMINSRHHANEVSSTNAALRLVQLAGQGALQESLRRCSIVINPLENVDGAAIHHAMMRQHPTWKLHAARFNAAGLEFYGEWFNPDTIYGEARVVQDLFAAYRPDIFLDDHGVPSHEWIQPFSGYSSAPYFRVSYWLPNAILYGIFRDLPAESHPAQAAAMPALRAILTERVRRNENLFAWNRLWLDRYRKYGHVWEPRQFPLEVHEGMICYTWPARGNSHSQLYPETCVIDWVTEVPDETAQGAHLNLCTEAHLEAHFACLDFFLEHPQPVVRTGSGSTLRVGRIRPFRLQ